MEVLEKNNWIFKDPYTGDIYPVETTMTHTLEKGKWYLIGDCVYECIGDIESANSITQGKIVKINGNWKIEPYKEEALKQRFSEIHIRTEDEYEKEMDLSNDFDKVILDYIDTYEHGDNLMLQMSSQSISNGKIFLPELHPDDDPFEKAIKSMLIHLKVVLNDYKHNVDKPHIVDNLRSALSGATKDMSVTKFLLWCKVLQLDWEIRLADASDNVKNKIGNDIVVSNKNDTWKDIEPDEDKSIFIVPLLKGEDPLKRAIKLALDKKRINTKKCEDKSSSSHLINNMKSALKNKQKMTMLYFMSWCELLDLIFEVKVTDPKTGIYYQVIGYDVYTNAETSEEEDV